MIHLDTSALIASLAGERPTAPVLRGFAADGLRLGLSSVVLYEWWRGPRTQQELDDQEILFPAASAAAFGVEEAVVAAGIYRRLKRPRQREIDIAIAACAITHDAALWTMNPQDFRDIPGLELA